MLRTEQRRCLVSLMLLQLARRRGMQMGSAAERQGETAGHGADEAEQDEEDALAGFELRATNAHEGGAQPIAFGTNCEEVGRVRRVDSDVSFGLSELSAAAGGDGDSEAEMEEGEDEEGEKVMAAEGPRPGPGSGRRANSAAGGSQPEEQLSSESSEWEIQEDGAAPGSCAEPR
jgi:hypothetical protein